MITDINRELAKIGYKAVKLTAKQLEKAGIPKLSIWAKRRIAREYKGPSWEKCVIDREKIRHLQVIDCMRTWLCKGNSFPKIPEHMSPYEWYQNPLSAFPTKLPGPLQLTYNSWTRRDLVYRGDAAPPIKRVTCVLRINKYDDKYSIREVRP